MTTRLRLERKRLGMNQTEAARAVGVSRFTFAQYECGKRQPRRNRVGVLEATFGLPIDQLLARAEDQAGNAE